MLSNASTLILGGARSGKSNYAEKIALDSGKELIYIATARVLDDEMEQRVQKHKKNRSSLSWTTIEEPVMLAKTLEQLASPNKIILVDCLTMWLTNLLTSESPALLEKEVEKLFLSITKLSCSVIFVSNEVGTGIIPMGELTRKFVDEAGRLHQQLAKRVDNVIYIVAGIPLKIKNNGEQIELDK